MRITLEYRVLQYIWTLRRRQPTIRINYEEEGIQRTQTIRSVFFQDVAISKTIHSSLKLLEFSRNYKLKIWR